MALHTESLYRPTSTSGDRVVLLHGFTQNGRCWGSLPQALTRHRVFDGREIVALDCPGHGMSEAAYDEVDLWQAAQLTVESVGEPAVYVGYSMGARIALHAAIVNPQSIAALVLIGATAGIDDEAGRRARRQADAELADRIDTEPLETFIDRWLANPLFAGLDPMAAARDQRLTNRPAGLSATLRHRGTGNQDSLWDRLDAVEAPVLVMAGDDDEKFVAIGRRLVEALPNARFRSLPGTHPVHLEASEQTAAVLADFLAELMSADGE